MSSKHKLVAGMDLYTTLTKEIMITDNYDKKEFDRLRSIVKHTFMGLVTETPMEQVATDTGTPLRIILTLVKRLSREVIAMAYKTVVDTSDEGKASLQNTFVTYQTMNEYYINAVTMQSGKVIDQYYKFGNFPSNIPAEQVFHLMLHELERDYTIVGKLVVKQFSLLKQAAVPPIGTPLGNTNG